jgi:hypothetical protein
MKDAPEPIAIRLGSLQVGDVAGHGEDEHLAAKRDRPRRDQDGRDCPVPIAELRLQVPDAVVAPETLDQPPLILRGVPDPDVLGGASQDLGCRPAGELREALVHGQESAVAEPVQAQGVGTGLERDAEALLALPERVLGADAVGDVPEDRAPVLLAPRSGDQDGREFDREGRAVASPELKLARRGPLRLPFGEHGGKRRVVHHHSGAAHPLSLGLRHAKRAAGGWIGADHRPVQPGEQDPIRAVLEEALVEPGCFRVGGRHARTAGIGKDWTSPGVCAFRSAPSTRAGDRPAPDHPQIASTQRDNRGYGPVGVHVQGLKIPASTRRSRDPILTHD